jgi:hypothetical protein
MAGGTHPRRCSTDRCECTSHTTRWRWRRQRRRCWQELACSRKCGPIFAIDLARRPRRRICCIPSCTHSLTHSLTVSLAHPLSAARSLARTHSRPPPRPLALPRHARWRMPCLSDRHVVHAQGPYAPPSDSGRPVTGQLPSRPSSSAGRGNGARSTLQRYFRFQEFVCNSLVRARVCVCGVCVCAVFCVRALLA